MKDRLMRHRPGIDPKPEDRTDWDRLHAMTDQEVEAAALADPDAQPLTEAELARCFRPGMLRAVRDRLGLDDAEFARRFHIDLAALHAWEEGRTVPEGMALAYLRVIERNPAAVLSALEG